MIQQLLLGSISLEQRATLEQSREHYKKLKKSHQRVRHREVKDRNSREALQANDKWIPLVALAAIQAEVNIKVDELLTATKLMGVKATMEQAVFFRRATVFTIYSKSKICRRGIYIALNVGIWSALPLDTKGNKVRTV